MAYEPEIEKLERKYQDDPARHFAQLAEQYRRADRLDEALDILTRHLEERPNYVSGLIVLGRCYLDRRDDSAARETFERVLALDAEHIIALKALGDLADRAGDGPEAIRWLERLLEVDPMNEEAQASLDRIKTEGPMGPIEEQGAEEAEAAEAVAPEAAVERTPEFSPPAATPSERDAPSLIEPEPVSEAESPGGVEAAAAADDDLQLERVTPAFEPSPEPVVQSPLDEAFGQDEPGEHESTVPMEAIGDDAPPSGLAEAAEASDVEDAEPAATPGAFEGADAPEMDFQSFDSELEWGTGERTSQQISDEDLVEAEHLHSDDVEPVAHELPGLETAFVPPVGDEAPPTEAVEGLSDVVPMEVAEPAEEAEAPDEAGEAEGAEAFAAAEWQGGSAAEAAEGVEEGTAAEAAEGEAPAPAEQPARFELEAVAEVEEEEIVVAETSEPRGSLSGLPLILPPEDDEEESEVEPDAAQDAEPEPAASAAKGSDQAAESEQEPEPVVTETMAELYARQGLVSEAADVYRELLRDRPDDPRLTARLQELERHERVSASSPGLSAGYHAAETNGQSAREFLGQILASRPGAAAVPEAPAAPASPAPAQEDFADQPVHPRGNPTQPASNDISLASAFGENPPEPPAQRPSGFSFDEFFGGTPPEAPPPASERPSHAVERDDEGDAAFRQWLKGLKS